jgi:hypothetical protein
MVEKTITYERERWRVWVDAAPDPDRSKSGLELVFSGPDGRELRRAVGPSLLHLLELDEELLKEALAAELEREDDGESDRAARGGMR